jgi:hypothetical protein
MKQILAGADTSGQFDYLNESERKHIMRILMDTGVLQG